MRTTELVLLLAVAVVALAGCGGNPPPIPDDCRLFGCGDGFQCVEQDGGEYACEPIPPCEEAGCPDGQVCEDGSCRPATCLDVGCPDGQQCLEDGQCVPDNCPLNGHPEGEPNWPWCKDVSQKCSNPPDEPCKTNPSSDPYYCEEAVRCQDPLPQPQCPTFTDRGGTLRVQGEPCDCWLGQVWAGDCAPPPPPGECVFYGDDEDGTHWKAWTPGQKPTEHYDEYRKGLAAVGDTCGKPPMESLRAMAAAITEQGVCAKQEHDSVSILRPSDGMYEEWHAVYFGNGCAINGPNAHKATWQYLAAGCPQPHPDLDRMKFGMGNHNGAWDTTWTTVGQPDYCASIGFCCMPGTGSPPNTCGSPGCIPRGGCPVRPEGHAERAACERRFIGTQQWWCDGAKITRKCRPDVGAPCLLPNPAQARCLGLARTCTENGRTCSEKNWSEVAFSPRPAYEFVELPSTDSFCMGELCFSESGWWARTFPVKQEAP